MKYNRKTREDDKVRNWTFVIYPESAPIDFIDRISNMIVPCVISPLHKSDDEEGKAHRHVMLSFDSPTAAKKVLSLLYEYEIEKGVAGYTPTKLNYQMIHPVSNSKSMIRYFCHLDQPTKEQLFWKDMLSFNGLDIDYVLVPAFSEQLEFVNDIILYIEKENVFYFYDLVNYARHYYYDTWFLYLKDHSYFIKEYLRSKADRRKYEEEKKEKQQEINAKH